MYLLISTFSSLTLISFWAGPLRGIFANLQRGNILKDVQTLILDGLSVPAELISEMILNDSYHIRILSIREVKNLNEQKLMQVLRYAVRPSRSKNTPRLEGLYVFGRREPPPVIKDFKRHVNRYPPGIAPLDTIPQYGGVMSSQGAQIGAEWNLKSQEALSDCLNHTNQGWYIKTGKLFARQLTHTMNQDWAATILACKGIIQFDAVLCPGPRHSTDSPHMRKLSTHSRDGEAAEYSPVWYNRLDAYISPSVALVSVRGCAICGISPEGITIYGKSETSRFPLLAPPPLHASTLKSAIHPPPISSGEKGRLIVRCSACMSGRYCESCHKWWCEDCYQIEDDEKKPRHPNTPTNGGKALLPPDAENVKVHMGFCVADCLVGEMMAGAGSGGMWG